MSITVAIPSYNMAAWIDRTIQSVISQDVPGLRVIVVDDGSTDNTLDVLRAHGDKITWTQQQHAGAAAARNRALAMADQDWILFLDADDYVGPDSLAYWLADSGGDVVLCPWRYEMDGRLWSVNVYPDPVTTETVLKRWLSGYYVPTCSLLWRRSFLQSIGGWREDISNGDDAELALRALLHGAKPVASTRGCGIYFFHDAPGRLSQLHGRAIIETNLKVHCDLAEEAKRLGWEKILPFFGMAFYRLSYEAYFAHFDDLGARAEREARQNGFKGHRGTIMHRCLAGILGLRLKLRLTGLLRGRGNDGTGRHR
jgi:glycosyltransferase involved in cell wall biosynthesis